MINRHSNDTIAIARLPVDFCLTFLIVYGLKLMIFLNKQEINE